jgi:hypothetical protein
MLQAVIRYLLFRFIVYSEFSFTLQPFRENAFLLFSFSFKFLLRSVMPVRTIHRMLVNSLEYPAPPPPPQKTPIQHPITKTPGDGFLAVGGDKG